MYGITHPNLHMIIKSCIILISIRILVLVRAYIPTVALVYVSTGRDTELV